MPRRSLPSALRPGPPSSDYDTAAAGWTRSCYAAAPAVPARGCGCQLRTARIVVLASCAGSALPRIRRRAAEDGARPSTWSLGVQSRGPASIGARRRSWRGLRVARPVEVANSRPRERDRGAVGEVQPADARRRTPAPLARRADEAAVEELLDDRVRVALHDRRAPAWAAHATGAIGSPSTAPASGPRAGHRSRVVGAAATPTAHRGVGNCGSAISVSSSEVAGPPSG